MLSKVEKKVLDKAYSSNKAYDDLITLCDRYGGRFAGSEENREAAEYLLGLFEDSGFQNPHLESFTFKGCTVGASNLRIKGAKRRKIQTLTPDGKTVYGPVRGVRLHKAPKELIACALKATNTIGKGLYGVDLKQTDNGYVVIEVNDNPTINAGDEDQTNGELYERLIRFLLPT